MIPKDQILQIVERLNIVEIVGERLDLKRAGVNYKACCPFHEEKSASFVVSEAKQVFKCFGCGAAGDVIKFVQLYDGFTYIEAIKNLAQRAGVEIRVESFRQQKEHKEEENLREQMLIAMAESAKYFHHNLLNELESGENRALLDYLEKRKLSPELCKIYQIGYAPLGWNGLKKEDFFISIDNDFLVEVGLLKKSEQNKYYDFFRNRLMFPIFDSAGNVIAFSGRALNNEEQPKYINSPESIIYKKSKVLFGFYQAKEQIRRSKTAILVEGNLDQISLYKYGYKNSVALCGTAFTDDHAELLKRNAQKVIVMLDSDNAGIKSSFKTATTLLKKGLDTSLVMLSQGDDPDSFLEAKGNVAMDELIASPLSFIDYHLIVKDVESGSEEKSAVLKDIIETIAQIPDRIKKSVYLAEASQKLKISEAMLISEIKNRMQEISEKKSFQAAKPEIVAPIKNKPFIWQKEDEVEFNIIFLMITFPDQNKKFISELTEDNFENSEAKNLFFKLFVSFEDGEELKLNELLLGAENSGFVEFFIGYIATQEQLYDPSRYESKDLEEKISNAYNDNLKKIQIKKIRREMKLVSVAMESVSAEDFDLQEELLLKINQLKIAEKKILNN